MFEDDVENYVPPSAMQTLSRRQSTAQSSSSPQSSQRQTGAGAATASGSAAASSSASASASAGTGAPGPGPGPATGMLAVGQSRRQVLARGASPSVPLGARRGSQNDFQAKLKRLYKKLSSKNVGIYAANKVVHYTLLLLNYTVSYRMVNQQHINWYSSPEPISNKQAIVLYPNLSYPILCVLDSCVSRCGATTCSRTRSRASRAFRARTCSSRAW